MEEHLSPYEEVKKALPMIFEGHIDMPRPNLPIIIFEGKYKIKAEYIKTNRDDVKGKKVIVESFALGKISYEWLPTSGVKFSGQIIDNQIDIDELLVFDVDYEISIDGIKQGTGKLHSIQYKLFDKTGTFKGRSQDFCINDTTIPVDKIKFSVPNIFDYFGETVIREIDNKISTHANRLILDNDQYHIIIDKFYDDKDRRNDLEDTGGYHLLANGELTSKKGHITLKESKDIIDCLNKFLSFINGRRISILFLQGLESDNVRWCEYKNYIVDQHKQVGSWFTHEIKGINNLWKNFSELWTTSHKDFISTAIHWYVEANGNSGLVEGALIMAQTNLELLFNWWIVERLKIIQGIDSERISASNKIRLVLSQLSIPLAAPIYYTSIIDFINNKLKSQVKDCPEAVVEIRNAIVHSQEKKRIELKNMKDRVKKEALFICLWYIELSLLKIFEFKELYCDRSSGYWKETNLPWEK